jgi:hypothetical protein
MKPHPVNAFEYTSVPYGDDGRLVRGIIARCGHCNAAIPLPVNVQAGGSSTAADDVEFQFIARKLEAKGWRIGKSRGSHRCPKCFSAAKSSAIYKSQEFHTKASTAVATGTVPHNNGVPMKVVENTRVMTREDRRIIFDKLNQVYVDGKNGYQSGWTDERVSTDLGVPRGWVRLIRDENFGDEVSNESIRTEIAQAKQFLIEFRAFQKSVVPEHARLVSLADKIEKSLSEIARVFK